jgi:hypothetical protein
LPGILCREELIDVAERQHVAGVLFFREVAKSTRVPDVTAAALNATVPW